ncbi:hypothetical protein LCGC14_2453210, partial [marine sediment metagenome]
MSNFLEQAEQSVLTEAFDWEHDEDGYLYVKPSVLWDDIAPKGEIPESLYPGPLIENLNAKLYEDNDATALEWHLCQNWDPKYPYQTGMWRWLTSWCYTFDSLDKKNPVKQFPKYGFLAELTQCHMERTNGLLPNHPHIVCVKPRAILWSIWLALKNLYGLMFKDNWSGFMMSAKLKRVDDGGRRASPNSLLGKALFSYKLQPEWMRSMAPIDFQQGVARNEASGAMLQAEVTGGDIGAAGLHVT